MLNRRQRAVALASSLLLAVSFASCGAEPGETDSGALGADAGTSLPWDGEDDAGAPPDAGHVPPEPIRPAVWPPVRPGYVNPIPAENAKAGDSQWSRMQQKARAGEIAGYADRATAVAGDTVGIKASCDTAAGAAWQLYRLGWYGGAGARRVGEGRFACAPQPRCPMDGATGRVQCAWPDAFELPLDASHVSGLYLVKLVRDDGFSAWVPLVVRDDRPADLLFQASTTTWQAYNDWGGASLYRDPSGTLRRGRAVEVSFDRPYTEGSGAGQLLMFEHHFARFLERHGYDVAYTDNTWVSAAGASALVRRGAFLSVGHDEYWTGAERDALHGARDAGMPLLFFSANSAYWQVRLGDDRGAGARRLTCFKEWHAEDPDQGPHRTAKFRDVDRPENALLGVMFDAWHHLRFPLVVEDASHFLFRGTGLRAGDALPWLVGYESDRRYSNGAEPAGVAVAARVPLVDVEGAVKVAETVSYRAPSGALVFATGTIEWALGLAAGPIFDPRLERMTANVFTEALGLAAPASVGTAPAPVRPVNGPFAADVRTAAEGVGTPVAVAVLPDGALAVADQQTHRILRVDHGAVTVLAGSVRGRGGWDRAVPATQAQFDRPGALLVDPEGQLVIADTGNHCLRRLSLADGLVSTIAGACGTPGFADGDGDDARFIYPMGLAYDATRGELVVADPWNHRVRTVAFGAWATRTLAGQSNGQRDGPAASALLAYPTAVAADELGRIYAVNSGTFSVVRIDTDSARTVTTLTSGAPGAADGPGTTAGLGPQAGLAWRAGALVVSDTANGRLRRVRPGSDAAGTTVSTLAGGHRRVGADGPGEHASFLLPLGLAVAPDGTVFVADAARGRIVAVEP